jgi:hypothetical protein
VAGTESQFEAAARKQIERRRILGDAHGILPGAEANSGCPRRRLREKYEWRGKPAPVLMEMMLREPVSFVKSRSPSCRTSRSSSGELPLGERSRDLASRPTREIRGYRIRLPRQWWAFIEAAVFSLSPLRQRRRRSSDSGRFVGYFGGFRVGSYRRNRYPRGGKSIGNPAPHCRLTQRWGNKIALSTVLPPE